MAIPPDKPETQDASVAMFREKRDEKAKRAAQSFNDTVTMQSVDAQDIFANLKLMLELFFTQLCGDPERADILRACLGYPDSYTDTPSLRQPWQKAGETHDRPQKPFLDSYRDRLAQRNGGAPAPDPFAAVSGDAKDAFNMFMEHVRHREGYSRKVYKDSKGYLTVGIGHRVLKEDHLKFGDVISDDAVLSFFREDTEKAFRAATRQAQEAGLTDAKSIAGLASVNFQMGTGWTDTFYNSWPAIKRKDYESAIENLRKSAWYGQTPKRVEDFIAVLENAIKIRDGQIAPPTALAQNNNDITSPKTAPAPPTPEQHPAPLPPAG